MKREDQDDESQQQSRYKKPVIAVTDRQQRGLYLYRYTQAGMSGYKNAGLIHKCGEMVCVYKL